MKYSENTNSRNTYIHIAFVISFIFILGSCQRNEQPYINLITPIKYINVVSGDTIQIQVEAFDDDGSIAEVDFLLDNNLVKTDKEPPFEYNMRCLFEMSSDFKIYAVDDKGEKSEEERISIWCDPNENVNVFLGFEETNENSMKAIVTANSPYGEIQRVTLCKWNTILETKTEPPYEFLLSEINDLSDLYAKAYDENGIMGSSKK